MFLQARLRIILGSEPEAVNSSEKETFKRSDTPTNETLAEVL